MCLIREVNALCLIRKGCNKRKVYVFTIRERYVCLIRRGYIYSVKEGYMVLKKRKG